MNDYPKNLLPLFLLFAAIIGVLSLPKVAFAQAPSVQELVNELDLYAGKRAKEIVGQGKRLDAGTRDDIEREKKKLAEKYASQTAARSDLSNTDYYFLGILYLEAENETKVLDSMKQFLAKYPDDTEGDMIQNARVHVVIRSAQKKQMADAEQYFQLWLKGKPFNQNLRPALQDQLSAGYFKSGQYDQSVRHAQEAFDFLKTIKANTYQEKRTRERIYMNLVEMLALAYRKNKNGDQSLNVLAEARAQSFAIPSADLYRKVMQLVEGGGFSEKKLMQKVESYASADPAPELKVIEWLGDEPTSFAQLRGKVVLVDFWATWCIPCISTFPRLRDWHKKYGGGDFAIVGVTQYDGQKDGKKMSQLQELEYVREFKQKYKLPYTIAISNGGEAAMKYGINAYPTTVLLDRNGVVRYIGVGAGSEESENLEDMIKKVLKEEGRLANIN